VVVVDCTIDVKAVEIVSTLCEVDDAFEVCLLSAPIGVLGERLDDNVVPLNRSEAPFGGTTEVGDEEGLGIC